MRALYKLKALWHLWRSPKVEYAADYEVLVRLARRCAYDFAHAAAFIPEQTFYMSRSEWEERANWWVRLFAKGNPVKDYRARLVEERDQAQDIAREAIALLRQHDIPVPRHMDGLELPF